VKKFGSCSSFHNQSSMIDCKAKKATCVCERVSPSPPKKEIALEREGWRSAGQREGEGDTLFFCAVFCRTHASHVETSVDAFCFLFIVQLLRCC